MVVEVWRPVITFEGRSKPGNGWWKKRVVVGMGCGEKARGALNRRLSGGR